MMSVVRPAVSRRNAPNSKRSVSASTALVGERVAPARRPKVLGWAVADIDEVVATLKSVVHDDPKVIDAWFMLGNMYAKVGRQEAAIPYFKQALALKPDDDMAVVNLANAYRQLGRDEEALV